MPAVIYEMSRKGLGMTRLPTGQALVGILSDGDLRRLLEAKGTGCAGYDGGRCNEWQRLRRSVRMSLPRKAEHDGGEEDYFAGGRRGGWQGWPACSICMICGTGVDLDRHGKE